MTDTFTSKMFAVAVAGPVVLTTLAVIAFSGQELRGESPFSYGPMRNIAEAAAMGHASEVLRLLAAGQDPNRVWPVRRDIISSTITEVTALEAAVWSRRVQLVELLDRQGVIDDQSRHHLACLANDLENPVEDIIRYLAAEGPLNCPHGQAIAAVLERSREP